MARYTFAQVQALAASKGYELVGKSGNYTCDTLKAKTLEQMLNLLSQHNNESEQQKAQAELEAHISQQAEEVAPEPTTETSDNVELDLEKASEVYENWVFPNNKPNSVTMTCDDVNKFESMFNTSDGLIPQFNIGEQHYVYVPACKLVSFRKPSAPRRVKRRAARFMSYLAA